MLNEVINQNNTTMRSIITLLLILPALLVFGQDSTGKPTYYVSEGARDFVSGTQNALIIELPGVEDKMAEKVWKNYIDKFGGKTKKMKVSFQRRFL